MIIEAKEQEKVIKQELQQKKWKRADPNAKAEAALYNPSMPTTDDTEDSSTWKERWLKDTRTRQVYTSSKLLSKTKHKMKLMKAVEAESQQLAAEGDQQQLGEGGEERGGGGKKGEEQQGIIGSIEEYASLVGKSVHQLADAKYEVPDPSESEGEDSAHSGEEGDSLWGAILGSDK